MRRVLRGEEGYRLRAPGDVIDSKATRNADGSMDVYFGPTFSYRYTFGRPKGPPLPPDPDID